MFAAILEAGGTKLRTQKAKVQQIADELDAASTAITKIQVNAESFQKHQKTAQKALSSAQEEKQAVQEQIEQLKAELKQLEDDAVRVWRRACGLVRLSTSIDLLVHPCLTGYGSVQGRRGESQIQER